MTHDSLTLREAEGGDRERIAALLAANDLPNRDLDESPGQFFVGHADGDLAAAGGVELYGASALLRSVVVAAPHRSRGYGAALCDELEAYAAANGAETLYLLTTTAAGFFSDLGYEPTERETVPEAIRRSTLFTDHCPESAACLSKPLD